MQAIHTVRLAFTLGFVCGIAVATDTARAADLAEVLGATSLAAATPRTTPPPALLPQAADQALAPHPDSPDSAPARHGLRFPERILLLSGAKTDDPRSFVVLGTPDGESPAASAGTSGEGVAVQASEATPTPKTEKQAAVVEDATSADRRSEPQPPLREGPAPLGRGPDPLAGTPRIDPAATGGDAEKILATMLPQRTDTSADWFAPLEPLHFCGEPRALAPCVPPPPCHPAQPPQPFDLVGQRGTPTCGPIYGGPCDPRSGTCHDGPLAPFHRACDRLFDRFYTPR